MLPNQFDEKKENKNCECVNADLISRHTSSCHILLHLEYISLSVLEASSMESVFRG